MAPESHQNLFNMGSLTKSHITTNEVFACFTRNEVSISRKSIMSNIFVKLFVKTEKLAESYNKTNTVYCSAQYDCVLNIQPLN